MLTSIINNHHLQSYIRNKLRNNQQIIVDFCVEQHRFDKDKRRYVGGFFTSDDLRLMVNTLFTFDGKYMIYF